LPAVKLEAFAPELPQKGAWEGKPGLRDSAATVENAANFGRVMKMLGAQLTPEQKKFLNEHKFLLLPKRATKYKGKLDKWCVWDEMLGLFDEVGGDVMLDLHRKPENAKLVTPDVLLHTVHKYLQNSLEYLERYDLAPLLRRFLQQARAKALEYQAKSTGKLAARYELLAAQLTVPLVVLENCQWQISFEERMNKGLELADKADLNETLESALTGLGKFKQQFSPEVFGRMTQEIRNIYQAKEVAPSPLYGPYDESVKADYTQFTPRSHYAKTSVSRGYFRAMMYLGRNSYPLAKAEGLSDALLLAHLLASPGANGQPLFKDWKKLMEITGFYAGAPDDLGFPEWRDFIVKVLGTEKFSPPDALNQETLAKISGRLEELRLPRIMGDVVIRESVPEQTKEDLLAALKAFRLFGQRFSLDAWILNRLTAGEEKSGARLPSTPSALFVAAAMADKAALSFTEEFLKKETPPFSREEIAGFLGKMADVAGDLAKYQGWYDSAGAAWLKLLGTLTASHTYGDGYPLYMRGKLFPVKQLQTFLGSYTELKHDTLLYVKQSFAEMGGGGEGTPPPVPKGFVEPNIAFWQELQRLVLYIEAGFKKYGIFKKELEEFGRLRVLKENVDFYYGLAVKELENKPLSEEEYEKLRTTNLSHLAAPFDEGAVLAEKEKRSGLIADIHTDAVKGQVLYEATGEPYFMLVLVGNEGTSRVAVGLAFNHYEFTGPLARRYTDSDWQERVYKSPPQLPPKNFWYQGLAVK
jgi:hypothetical protein